MRIIILEAKPGVVSKENDSMMNMKREGIDDMKPCYMMHETISTRGNVTRT